MRFVRARVMVATLASYIAGMRISVRVGIRSGDGAGLARPHRSFLRPTRVSRGEPLMRAGGAREGVRDFQLAEAPAVLQILAQEDIATRIDRRLHDQGVPHGKRMGLVQ